jgi:hypothetical protein
MYKCHIPITRFGGYGATCYLYFLSIIIHVYILCTLQHFTVHHGWSLKADGTMAGFLAAYNAFSEFGDRADKVPAPSATSRTQERSTRKSFTENGGDGTTFEIQFIRWRLSIT